MADEATQPEGQATQNELDPRRLGRNNSGLSEEDISDVLCILHPASPLAYEIVKQTMRTNPQHVLQNQMFTRKEDDDQSDDDYETLTFRSSKPDLARGQDLALRFSSHVTNPALGFCFGRNMMKCDLNLDINGKGKRISGVHFRIYVNSNGVIMLEDTSINGTLVDGHPLRGREPAEDPRTKRKPGHNIPFQTTRMLNSGSIIEIIAIADEVIKFILRIPARDGHAVPYTEKLSQYLQHVEVTKQKAQQAAANGPPMSEATARAVLAGPMAGPPNSKAVPTFGPYIHKSSWGMQWDGAGKYNCIGMLGKGAFATVYHLATVREGDYFAGKELEKKRFVKNGILDPRLDNEMEIMKELSHENIVQYVGYYETPHHLYIIMEYVSCGDLNGYMQSRGTLPENLAKDMSKQILSALQYLHEKNITHRDIKPDNILISSEDPFWVKLTDFGLSKVVKNNETFLKTFCGTLLYCAPEVFPHYDNFVTKQKTKKRRAGSRSPPTVRSYSQLVDVWSYAAVLWFVLCGSPPFEGVNDGTGHGMFQQIMLTRLDCRPLQSKGVTDECIDLLVRMLDTDPTTRLTEQECLDHPWLSGKSMSDYQLSDGTLNEGQREIPVEDLVASQLSIHDTGDDLGEDASQSFSSDAFDASHATKRQKGESFISHNYRSNDVDSPDEKSANESDLIPIYHDIQDEATYTPSKPARLFGEISNSALRSSGVLGKNTVALEVDPVNGKRTEGKTFDRAPNVKPDKADFNPHKAQKPHEAPATSAAASLLGAESMVRDLNMSSPETANSALTSPDDTVNPRTPPPHETSLSTPRKNSTTSQEKTIEKTPKQSTFSRQINLGPPTASFFYDPYDVSTHNLEYASKVSGIDFVSEQASSHVAQTGLADTLGAQMNSSIWSIPEIGGNIANVEPRDAQPNTSTTSQTLQAPQSASGSFVRPPLPLGRLITAAGSFLSMSLSLTQRTTTWGRAPSNTFVYSNSIDTRVARVALELWFHSEGMERAGDDWMKLPDLVCIVRTQSKNGILVNGVRLDDRSASGQFLYGVIHTGDVITIWDKKEEGLAFICEFYAGASARSRGAEDVFVVKTST